MNLDFLAHRSSNLFWVSGVISAITGGGAASPLAFIRNASATKLIHVVQIDIRLALSTDLTNAGAFSVAVGKATGFSASDTGGTAAVPLKRGTQALRKYDGTVDPAGASSVAATESRFGTPLLTAGTRTLNTDQPLALATVVQGAAAAAAVAVQAWDQFYAWDNFGVPLEVNEGLVLYQLAAIGAGGQAQAYWRVLFAEV